MALRVVEQAGLTDVGRQREANEDNLVLDAPVFAVADGMGGARAGEVASQIATEAFRDPRDPGQTPEQQLERVAQEANRRIYELALRDESRRGMGTTLTATLVDGDCVSVGHVGDSRAYRLRDGALTQLTQDHSLVAELERSGQLTPEAAEHHPQRSIITRALGPEREVEVDTHTHAARSGDVYVLCSDGLTGMISDDELATLVRAAPSLESAAEALVRAANQSGGKDNITVVLFRLEDDGSGPAGDPPTAEETIHQGLSADDVRAAAEERDRDLSRASSATLPPTAGATSSRSLPRERAGAGRKRPASRSAKARRVLAGVAALAITGVLAVGAYLASRQVYFLGTDDTGFVTVYRGLPYELPLGIDLYSAQYRSGVPAASIPVARRDRVLDHEWRSESDAEDLVRQLELGALDPGRPVQ
ncbi:MAG TPA: Stp1/IreP family PP2C-type Ser/Thr phosphatase [Thermoleophilaceae bacterium]|nr:Stp1/IreP family PP2C-type Ser/Thr phosphatase [Thermoleophilaceae bacterium]